MVILFPSLMAQSVLAGNIIWATDIVERKTTKKVRSGGKGGSSRTQKVTTLFLFCKFCYFIMRR
jgi:hypothetical protein